MFDWLKNINKETPEFWKKYIQRFEDKNPARYVVINTQSTGSNPSKDVILSIGAVAVINNEIVISDSFEVVLLQYIYMHDHGLSNEFIIESKQPKLGEQQAIQAFIEYIDNAILVGYQIHFEVDMINRALEKMNCGRIKNQALDIEIMYQKLTEETDKHFSIEEICKAFKTPIENSQTTMDNAYTFAILFLKLKSRLRLN